GTGQPTVTGQPRSEQHRHLETVLPSQDLAPPDPMPSRIVLRAVVTKDPLDVEEHARLVASSAAGAVVSFSGGVRDHDGGKEVRALEYVDHPSAGEVITRVATQISAAHPEVLGLAVSHRIGSLMIGDSALACAVAAAHRAAAFEACAALVDEVKLQ